MSYNYEQMKPELFSDDGQRMFLKIRDRAKLLLKEAGAFRLQEVIRDCGGGSSWLMIACVDRMVELKEIQELQRPCAGQHKVYTDFTSL